MAVSVSGWGTAQSIWWVQRVSAGL